MNFTFDYTSDYRLEDEAVLLRPLQASDEQYLLPFALNEPDTWQYSMLSAAGADGLSRYIDQALQARAAGGEYPFIVFDKTTNSYAGCTRFYDIQLPMQRLQLGYTWYGMRFRGTGLNKHCKYLLLQFAFEQLDMLRVEFRADTLNEKSIAAMKSIGCTPEGVLRSYNARPDGSGRRDTIILSILKSEWEQGVKAKLREKIYSSLQKHK